MDAVVSCLASKLGVGIPSCFVDEASIVLPSALRAMIFPLPRLASFHSVSIALDVRFFIRIVRARIRGD